MKNLIILLILLPAYCFSQNPATEIGTDHPTRQDTIKVILIVSDTAYGNYTEMTARLWWQFGYEVYENVFVPAHTESIHNGDGILLVEDERSRRFVIRLDQNKKPIPKNILVWMSKEIKE